MTIFAKDECRLILACKGFSDFCPVPGKGKKCACKGRNLTLLAVLPVVAELDFSDLSNGVTVYGGVLFSFF